MIWAGISRGGRTYPHIVLKGMMTSLCYRDDMLDVYVRPYAGVIGTISSLWTTTLAFIVSGWLRSRLRSTSSRRPSSVWTAQHAHLISTRSSMFGTCYRWRFCDVQPNPTTLGELENAPTEDWNNLEMAATQRLIGSTRSRCQAVIASRGSHTSY